LARARSVDPAEWLRSAKFIILRVQIIYCRA
jgi:hypothetical protein